MTTYWGVGVGMPDTSYQKLVDLAAVSKLATGHT